MAGKSEPADQAPVIVVTRFFDAPAERVFDAWLDPAMVGRWLFATAGGEMKRVEVDARVGGEFTIIEKRGETLAEHFGKYTEIDRPRRLVFTFATSKEQNPTRVTVEITPASAGCSLKLTHEMDPKWAAYTDRAREGWTRILERLAMTALADQDFVITRVFDAPRDLVFKVWTSAEHLEHWFGPKGTTLHKAKLDLRPGGGLLACMRSPDGRDMWGKWVFREIVVPERIVFVNSFSDENGGLTRHPMSPTWPLEMLTTITFAEEHGKTKLTLRWIPINATQDERKAFDGGRESMRLGWTGTFENLEAYLDLQTRGVK